MMAIAVALDLVDDSISIALVVATGFFLAVALGLLYRYRQVSQTVNKSTDLGRDLWQALDQRMKKQDERIIDLMARVEVLQARVTAVAMNPTPTTPMAFSPTIQGTPSPAKTTGSSAKVAAEVREPPALHPVAPPAPSVPSLESQAKSPMSQVPTEEGAIESRPSQPATPRVLKLDKTSQRALQLLKEGPMTTAQLWDEKALNLGREHTSRLMKKLFELGLVARDDANKPYTYQLTDEGRRYAG